MDYFKYNAKEKVKSTKEIYNIYSSVQNLKNYAKKIYGGRWEDALDISFFHIVQNYDPEKGDLENYAIKVIKNICLNQFGKEMPYEFIADVSEESINSVVGEVGNYSGDKNNLVDCINFLSPYFIKDFKFFSSLNTTDRKEKYLDLFKKFEYKDILKAIKYLKDNYSEEVKKFCSVRRSCGKKGYDELKVYKCMNQSSIQYQGTINDIILYKKKKGTSSKVFYRVDIKESVKEFLKTFYMDGCPAVVKVENTVAYCTVTGSVVFSIEELIKSLENDIVGLVLSRSNLKVIKYVEGEELLLVSNKELEHNLNIAIFSGDIWIILHHMASKEVS